MVDDSNQVELFKERVAQLEAENEALRREADDLDRQVAELEDELATLSFDDSADDEEAEDLRREVAQLESEVESLSEANAELEAQFHLAQLGSPPALPGRQ